MSMSMSTLPTSRDFVTQLLNSLPSSSRDNADSNPLIDAPESVKKQLLSLQVLFPNEFLPALDLLDRKLVIRFQISIEEPTSTTGLNAATAAPNVQMHDNNEQLNDTTKPTTHNPTNTHSPPLQNTPDNGDTVHYVRSAQQRTSRFSTSYDSTTTYEVRLLAWNCTCPAFAFAAFPSIHPEPPVPTCPAYPEQEIHHGLSNEDSGAETKKWMFGGMSLGEGMPPVCKHLLACMLAERCRCLFGDCVEERRVSIETAAGWAAGWGDS